MLQLAPTSLAYDNVRKLTELNTTLSESYPWISSNGLRLYFANGNQSINSFYVSERPDTSSSFSTPTALNLNLTETSPSWLWFSENELDAYVCFVPEARVYYCHRSTINANFEPPILLTFNGLGSTSLFGLSLNSDQSKLYARLSNNSLTAFTRTSPTSFSLSSSLTSNNFTLYPGPLSKDELHFFIGALTNGVSSRLYQLSRTNTAQFFEIGSLELIDGINDEATDNSQPSRSANLEWVVFVRNSDGGWTGKNMFLARRNLLATNNPNTAVEFSVAAIPSTGNLTLQVDSKINTNEATISV